MTRKADGQLNIRYIKKSIVGTVIEELKETHPNLSQMVRDYIMFVKGYEILKTKEDIPKEDLREICLTNLQFFITQAEITKINLEREKHNINYQSKELQNIRKKEQKSIEIQEKKPIENPKTKAKSKNLSLINSLLPQ